MSSVELPLVAEWTPDVLERLPGEYRYEVHGGNLVVMSAAMRAWHADVQVRVCALLRDQGLQAFIEQGVALAPGEVRTTDVAVFREAPDLDRAIHAPSMFLLIVEVESPSSQHADRVDRPRDYASAGVPEYWRAEEGDDGHPIVHQHVLRAGVYVETQVSALTSLEQDGARP